MSGFNGIVADAHKARRLSGKHFTEACKYMRGDLEAAADLLDAAYCVLAGFEARYGVEDGIDQSAIACEVEKLDMRALDELCAAVGNLAFRVKEGEFSVRRDAA